MAASREPGTRGCAPTRGRGGGVAGPRRRPCLFCRCFSQRRPSFRKARLSLSAQATPGDFRPPQASTSASRISPTGAAYRAVPPAAPTHRTAGRCAIVWRSCVDGPASVGPPERIHGATPWARKVRHPCPVPRRRPASRFRRPERPRTRQTGSRYAGFSSAVEGHREIPALSARTAPGGAFAVSFMRRNEATMARMHSVCAWLPMPRAGRACGLEQARRAARPAGPMPWTGNSITQDC